MPSAKRVSTASPGRSAKQPRTSVASPGRPSKAGKPYQPALDLVDKASKSLPKSCVAMLNSALPHVFTAPRDERHGYQTSIIESLTKLGADEHERLRATLVAVEADLETLKTEESGAAGKLDELKADAQSKASDKEAKEADSTSKSAAAAAAAEAKKEAGAKVVAAEGEVKAAQVKKAEFEENMGQWEALKGCTFPKKEWRVRNKAITVIVGCLKEAQAPKSLHSALSQVLMSGPERSAFASLVIEHSEKAMKEHIAKLDADIAKLETAVVDHKQAVEAADHDAKVAQDEAEAAMQAAIDAANIWVEAAGKVTEKEKTRAGFGRRVEELNSEIAQKKDALEAFGAIREKVQALVDGVALEQEQAQTPKSAGRKSVAATSPSLPLASP